jgi:hypothetical protein
MNEPLTRFLNELRVTQRLFQKDSVGIREHFGNLKVLMRQIEEQMSQSLPLLQIEQGIHEASFALSNFRKTLRESRASESANLDGELDGIIHQFEQVQTNREHGAAEMLSLALTSEVQKLKHNFEEESESNAVKLVLETAAVQMRMSELRTEQRECDPAQADEINLELEALLVQQKDLLGKLTALRSQ